jgi:lipopolysaccharide/colanic/teichoic acid biosynthesis glycosyltransferase
VTISLDSALRRGLDVIVSATVLVVLAPLLALMAALVKLSSRGPVFFMQERIGRGGAPFGLLKFRTMAIDASARGPTITVGADPRITPIGAVLRRYKLDELPQFGNVLRGDMSLVGPRPEVPEYVAQYTEEQRRVFTVRPGITDPASLAYHEEASLLATFDDPERAYREQVLPRKLAISLDYLARRTVASDLRVMAETALRMVVRPRAMSAFRAAGQRVARKP